VPRPDWLTPDRKTAYVPRKHPPRAESVHRRARIVELLKQGADWPRIIEQLHLTRIQLKFDLRVLCRQFGIKGERAALARHLGSPVRARKSPTRDEVHRRWMAGERQSQIARALGLKVSTIYSYVERFRRAGERPLGTGSKSTEMPGSRTTRLSGVAQTGASRVDA
jgi:transposase